MGEGESGVCVCVLQRVGRMWAWFAYELRENCRCGVGGDKSEVRERCG